MAHYGNLIIVSGPSGAGKSMLAASALQTIPHLNFSISYTTRAPRQGERDGREYYFVSQDDFESLIGRNDLLEWAKVYGNYYGTSWKYVDDLLQKGEDVLLDIDVQGARSVRQRRPASISIFILPPSLAILRDRLESRSLDKDYVIEQRLEIACNEIAHYHEYEYLIVNEDFSIASRELQAIILAARCRMAARAESAKAILATFGGMDAEYS